MTTKILAIDAGNTRIKWGLHDGRDWAIRDVVDIANAEGSRAFRDLQAATVVDQIVASNVAGSSVQAMIVEELRTFGKPISFVRAEARQCGVVNGYDNPMQLGSDRWAALIGAHTAASIAPRAQLVVMAGTALTVDALTADGRFLGGIIVPGLQLMQRALHRGTAQLPSTTGLHQIFPTNTANAVTTGTMLASAGAVQRMHAQFADQIGEMPYCVGGGGSIDMLAPHLSFPISINDNLVLDGLLVIARTLQTLTR